MCKSKLEASNKVFLMCRVLSHVRIVTGEKIWVKIAFSFFKKSGEGGKIKKLGRVDVQVHAKCYLYFKFCFMCNGENVNVCVKSEICFA